MTKEELMAKQIKLAEEFFGTAQDPDQMPINDDSRKKLDALCSGWLDTELDEAGEPISWAVVMPTQRELAEKFLKKEITEKQLLDLTQPAKIYDALYFVSVITVPEHRGEGLAMKVIRRAEKNMPIASDALYFAWPTTKEGEALFEKNKKIFNRKIELRK